MMGKMLEAPTYWLTNEGKRTNKILKKVIATELVLIKKKKKGNCAEG